MEREETIRLIAEVTKAVIPPTLHEVLLPIHAELQVLRVLAVTIAMRSGESASIAELLEQQVQLLSERVRQQFHESREDLADAQLQVLADISAALRAKD